MLVLLHVLHCYFTVYPQLIDVASVLFNKDLRSSAFLRPVHFSTFSCTLSSIANNTYAAALENPIKPDMMPTVVIQSNATNCVHTFTGECSTHAYRDTKRCKRYVHKQRVLISIGWKRHRGQRCTVLYIHRHVQLHKFRLCDENIHCTRGWKDSYKQ